MAVEKAYKPRLTQEPVVNASALSPHSLGIDYMQLFNAAQRLRFPQEAETEFIASYHSSTIKTTRLAFIAGFLIYALFGIVDIYVAPISLQQVWMIRLGIGCPTLLLMVLCTYIKRLYPVMQFLGAATTTIGGVGLVCIIMITEPEELAYTHYYAGLILVMLFTSSWLRLRFWYALSTNTLIIISYELVAIYVQQLLSTPGGRHLFINNSFILLGTYIIGAFANYSLELHTRIDFLQKRIIEVEKHKVTAQRIAIEQQANDLAKALESLKEAQSRLVNSEKLASLGELTAGIAHEIKNPLNFVTNFSEVCVELITDFEAQVNAGNKEETIILARDLKDIIEKIAFHGNRADSIVKSMLQHSRKGAGQKELTDINAMVEEYFRLSYQGLRARDKNFNTGMQMDLDKSIGSVNIVPQDIGRVLLNLFTNAFYSVNEKNRKMQSAQGTGQVSYSPNVTVSTKKLNGSIMIRVKDNGTGINSKAIAKMFQPFFTTKPPGEGIGLGLSLSHEIITQGHGGTINFETKEGEFAEFIIHLPV